MAVMTGLSGNEIYCLHQKGFKPGELTIGNSVYSMGFVGGIGAGINTFVGGEVNQVTEIIHTGRLLSYNRMLEHAGRNQATGITGVSSELIQHSGNIEFLSVASCLHRQNGDTAFEFSTSSDGQELYCLIDAGFTPKKFVFGNVAYSIGIGGGIGGMFRSLQRGEIREFSDIFNTTRHMALQRIKHEAAAAGANAVVGIQTTIVPFQGMQEMLMIGTAAHHPAVPPTPGGEPLTSDLTCEEMWNMVNLGYMPLELVLGVSVYSLGLAGGIAAAIKSFTKGEINEMTTMIYEARENAVAHLQRDAARVGADDVVGIKTYVYALGGGVIEFMAIGTAVKRFDGLTTVSPTLPPQAIIRDKDTFFNTAELALGKNLNEGS
ncbi:MAG: heavy metal-binding domain-containing protein [Fimbriimonadaceae bacterium]|nr:heavy metal-binding domain-containing protein [Fimbriimonadaceae bacterium]